MITRSNSPLFVLQFVPLLLVAFPIETSGSEMPVPERVFRDVHGKSLPFQTDREVEEFLRTAAVTSQRDIGTGVTKPKQLVLEKDGFEVRAAFNYVDQQGDNEPMADKTKEKFFLDSYKADIATYKLSRLLGLEMIPPGVERRVGDYIGVVRMWIEDLESYEDWLDEGNTGTPDSLYLRRQLKDQITFDLLIRNTDRNQGNINWDPDGNLWMIDQTRSLARDANLPDGDEKKFKGCSRGLYEAMLALEINDIKRELGPYIGAFEIKALVKRRDKLVKRIQAAIKDKSEDEVLFNYTDPPPGLKIQYDDDE